MKGVGIALGTVAVGECDALDINKDGAVGINELVTGIVAAQADCSGAGPSPTPTATVGGINTQTPTATITSTNTPSGPPPATNTPNTAALGVARRAAGTIESTTSALLAIPNLAAALLGHFGSLPTGGAGAQIFNIPFNCTGGGGGHVSCNQDIVIIPPSIGPPTYMFGFNDCKIDGGTGPTLTFKNTVTALGQAGQVCGTIPSPLNLSTQDFVVTSQTGTGSTTASFTGFSARTDLSCRSAPCQCSYDTVGLQLTGNVTVVSSDAEGTPITSTQATFGSGSSVQITVLQSNAQCIPVTYTMSVLGNVTFATDTNSFEAMLNPYTLHVDATSGSNLVDVSGVITSSCFGGMVRLSTSMPLLIPGTDACPAAGTIAVESAGGTDTLQFSNGQVEIDLGSDLTVDDTLSTCLAFRLFMCPAG